MKRTLLFLPLLFSMHLLVAQNNLYMDNAKYLYAKTASGSNTRTLGINSIDDLYLGSVDAPVNNFFVNLNGNNRITVRGNSGFLGIGTTNPLSKTHIYNGTSGKNPHGFADLAIEDDDNVMLSLMTTNFKTAYYGFADTNDDFVGGIQYSHPDDIMIFRVNDHVSDMVINKDGNVGIGTTMPTSKLAVNGKIHAKEVKVDLTGWPDYVFEKGYHIPTLEEVKRHIIEKGRLINVPSAKEVEMNGVELGEMNRLLLEKIEELTLYILNQEERIRKMESQLNP